ncbi:hypothetical protein [Streptomyces sp. NPDC048710]|uniref:hypothetical protein n=1 Tax=Streptomyces sp. NPDC048710 TaxID=3365586 RepID=UPI003714BF9E
MAWRDRLRRRAAGGPDTAERPRRAGRTGAPTAGPSGEGPDPNAPGGSGSAAPVPSVPHDWDGGWRRTAAPELTLSRGPLGVSDGLAFRGGLAAWQNPSFDNGLGHALQPTAPTGLVRGVARPAAARPTHTGGGPLLLRALRPEGAEGPQGEGAADARTPDGTARTPDGRTPPVRRRARTGERASGPAPSVSEPSGSAPSGPVPSGPTPSASAVRPTAGGNSRAREGRSSGAPRTRGLTPGDSPAVLSSSPPPVQRATAPGTAPVVTPTDTGRPPAAREIPLVRRVAVLPGTAAGGGMARSASEGSAPATRAGAPERDSANASRPTAGSGGRTPSGPVARPGATGTTGSQSARGGGQPQASRASGPEASHPAVRLRPVGARLTVARRPAGPARRIPALRPAATPATAGGTAPEARGPAPATTEPAGTAVPSTAPEQRAATRTGSRAPLGAPLSELPATAVTPTQAAPAPQSPPGAGSGSGRALPVVQRHAEGTAEGGVGAPRSADGGVSGTRLGASRSADGGVSGTGHGAPRPADGGVSGTRLGAPRPADGGGKGAAPGTPDGTDKSRRTHGPGRSGARVRGGLGAPLPALPASADLPGSAASGPRAARTAGPDIQRAPAHQDRGAGAAPAPSATGRDRTPGEAAPLRREEGGADAPLLGAVDVQRSLAGRPTTAGTTSPGSTGHGDGPATPLVTPSPVAAPESAAGPAGPAGPAGNASRSDGTPGEPGPGGQRPQAPGAPGPVVVARALAEAGTERTERTERTEHTERTERSRTPAAAPPSAPMAPRSLGTAGDRPRGAADPRVLTATGSGAHAVPAAPRTLQLLHARPLTVNTRAPEGVAQPAASRTGGRPVVAARWPGAAAAPQGEPAPPTGASARPSRNPSPSAGAPATPQVQRAVTAYGPENSGVRGTGSPGNVQRVPVVRPAPPGPETSGAFARAAAVPGRPLPVSAPLAPPLTDRPSATSAPAPDGTVPVVRPRNVAPGPRSTAGGGGTGPAAPPVQREVSGAGKTVPKGVPGKASPARGRQQPSGTSTTSSTSTASSASGKRTPHRTEAPQDPGIDLDDLARRLLDPMARLLRTELRRGRERTGRPYDGRR